jgi:imidazolonepropionase-like amidohydrolase
MQAIVANTRTVADVMGTLEDFGTLEAGKLADLLVIDGDPLKDVRLLQDKARLSVIMKGGELWRSDLPIRAA